MPFFSTTTTVLTTPTPITANKSLITKVIQLQIVVRSMGTATYVAIGGSDSQDRRLTSAGSSISISAEFQKGGKLLPINPLEIMCSSDTADAVIEVFGQAEL